MKKAGALNRDSDTVHPIVKQIIDRDCHVATPAKDVVRHVISKLKHGYETYRAMPEEERSMLIEQCVRHHLQNWSMYVGVMSGFTRTFEKRGAGTPLHASLSGKDLTYLMRKHRSTIRSLASKLGTTMQRIREARSKGLTGANAVRDWIQAITGSDPGPMPSRIQISTQIEFKECTFCGYPFSHRDEAFKYIDEVFCSITCCRKSRGW